MIDRLDVRVDGSIQRVRAAAFGTDAEVRWSDAIDRNVDWITRITLHVQDGHRHYASWCGACRRRRLLKFIGWTCVAASLTALALLNWWPAQ